MEFEGLILKENKKKICPGCGEPLNNENKCVNIHCDFFDMVFLEEEKEKEETKSLEKRGAIEQDYLLRHMMGEDVGGTFEVEKPEEIKKEAKKQIIEETQEKKKTDRLKR